MLCNAQSDSSAPQAEGASATQKRAKDATLEDWAIHSYDWTGLHVGGHFGFSRGQVNNTLFDPAGTSSSNSFGSLYGGFQFGYDYMLPSRLLLGVETDVTFPHSTRLTKV
jgi:high affinity Mn2+ porin